MPATFTQRFSVRFDECAPDGAARASTLLRYIVETAFGHSAREGFPLSWYDARGLYWLVRRAHLDLRQMVPYGTALDVTTEVVGFRRVWARRRNTVVDTAGRVAAVAVMDWIFTDRAGQPVRVVPEMEAAFPVLSERMDLERLDVGTAPAGASPLVSTVRPHEVDPRGHLNNAAYLDLFDDALAQQGLDPQARPAVYDLEYLRAALPGETLHRFLWRETQGWAMLTTTPEAVPVVRARYRQPDSHASIP